MTLKQAIKAITKDWEALHKAQTESGNTPARYGYVKTPAVWVAGSNIAGSYEVDEEWIGVTPQGNIIWAYASGCSCWCGEYDEDTKPTIKELKLEHEHTPEEWEQAIIKFAETRLVYEFPSV